MPDEQDLRDLQSGDVDMARRDFRDADLSGLDLSARDFSGAHLERAKATGTNFANCVFSKASLSGFQAEGGDLSFLDAQSTVFYAVNLRGALLRGAKLGRSHFTNADLSGADLTGADFSNAVLNEGTTFENCATDPSTRFDGARIFRPLARQEAFRFYRVERGILVRDDSGAQATDSPDVPGPDLGGFRDGPPRFDAAVGHFAVDFRSYNGRVFIGSGDYTFETVWTAAGNGSIHVYNDAPSVKAVAVAPDVNSIEQVTAAVFYRADFTSRTRTPRSGEVVILENSNGYVAAIQIGEVRVTRESTPGTVLNARYRILTDKTRDFGANPLSVAQLALSDAVSSALDALERVQPEARPDERAPSIGHNNPPPDSALSEEDYASVQATLRELRSPSTLGSLSTLERAREHLEAISRAVISWAGRKLAQIEEGFFTQIGATLADPKALLAGWILVSGKLDLVISAITAVLAP